MRYTAELYTPDGQQREKLLGTDYEGADQARTACMRYTEAQLTWERRGLEWWARGAHWWLRVSPQQGGQQGGQQEGGSAP